MTARYVFNVGVAALVLWAAVQAGVPQAQWWPVVVAFVAGLVGGELRLSRSGNNKGGRVRMFDGGPGSQPGQLPAGPPSNVRQRRARAATPRRRVTGRPRQPKRD